MHGTASTAPGLHLNSYSNQEPLECRPCSITSCLSFVTLNSNMNGRIMFLNIFEENIFLYSSDNLVLFFFVCLCFSSDNLVLSSK